MRKFNREKRAERDPAQGKISFAMDGLLCVTAENPAKAKKDLPNFGTCPFCLFRGATVSFLRTRKNGTWSDLCTCPDCGSGMTIRSLTQKMSIREFAAWVYKYIGFWAKCDFNKFKERLWKMGVASEFWEEYHKWKGEGKTDRQDRREYEEASRKVVKYWEK